MIATARLAFLPTLATALLWILPIHAAFAEPLIVHEWGTFTELQSLSGASIGGINTDDEPVPDFVHTIGDEILESTIEPWRRRALLGKGLRRLPNVTMRLETPVIYFYPPKDREKPLKIDVDVQLRGGWLSEFYPRGAVNAPGLKRRQLGRHAAGSLQWSDLNIALAHDSQTQKTRLPETDENVWLAPRKTDAAVVTTPDGESERYLFYRGVGAFEGPLRVTTDGVNDRLTLNSRFHTLDAVTPLQVSSAWLVSVRTDGQVAYRAIESFEASNEQPQIIGDVKRSFSAVDHSPGNLELLRSDMHAALVADGLFDDEATAMLSTWEQAYFRSPGLRLFYLLPRQWTDDRMPLTLSRSAEITRVMMGRIELISDRQQKLMNQIAAESVSEKYWTQTLPKSAATTRFYQGTNNLDELEKLGVEIPTGYRRYLELGRFRNALLRHETVRTRNPNLLKFLTKTGLLTSDIQTQLTQPNPQKPKQDHRVAKTASL